MARRKKQLAMPVPQTQAEAVELITEYVDFERHARTLCESADKAIARIEADRDAVIAAMQPDQDARFASIKAWWEATGHKIAGPRRSADVAGAKLGFRLGTPKVKIDKGASIPAIVRMIKGIRDGGVMAAKMLDIKTTLNRKVMIAARDDVKVAAVIAKLPLQIVQDDEFFIEAGPANAPAENVPTP